MAETQAVTPTTRSMLKRRRRNSAPHHPDPEERIPVLDSLHISTP
jgi:hypothetical protein